MTLNGGFSKIKVDTISKEDHDLIAEFMKNKSVTVVQPSTLSGNEASRATREIIAKSRREFRKANKPKKG